LQLKYYLPAVALPPRDEGITIERGLFAQSDTKEKNPLTEIAVGDIVRGKIKISIPSEYKNVAVEDMIPAGFEIVNFNLDTEDKTLGTEGSFGMTIPTNTASSDGLLTRVFSEITSIFSGSQTAQVYGSKMYEVQSDTYTQTLMPTHTESHDDRLFLFVENLPAGVYEYEYYLRALVPGEFQHLPARAEESYFPEIFGRTSGDLITVTPSK